MGTNEQEPTNHTYTVEPWNAVRLVQRKFAQGVHIPANSTAPPSERKAEPPYPLKSVYHNNMSASSLLDIVSMQNVHKHKQEPLVVLERLRDDEIPSPLPKVRRIRKRRVKPNTNNMCLRSGKRKSTDAAKTVGRKRKKLSSESTDDVPLMYYFNRPNQAKHNDTDKDSLDREKRILPPKTRERAGTLVSRKSASTRAETMKTDDRSFTFKEPTNPASLSYRQFKKKAAAKPVRSLKKPRVPLNGRWSSLRSARVSDARMARSLRAQVLLGKKPSKPAVKKASRTVLKDEKPPSLSAPSDSGDSGNGSNTVRDSVDSFSTILAQIGSNTVRDSVAVDSFSTILAQMDSNLNRSVSTTSSTVDVVNLTPTPTLAYDFDDVSVTGQPDWCINEIRERIKSESTMDPDVMTILRTSNRFSSITEVTTESDQNTQEQKLMSEAAALGDTSEKAKEKSNSEVSEKINVKRKDDSKVNKDNEKVDNEDTAQNTQTNYLDAQKRQANNLDAAKRQTDNLNAEKTQESLAADRNGESKNNVNVASSNSADVENREGRQRVQQSQKRGENNKGVKAKTTTKKAVEKNATKKNRQPDWCINEIRERIKSESTMDPDVMTILRTSNRFSSITEVTTESDQNTQEQKLMSEAAALGDTSEKAKEKSNSEVSEKINVKRKDDSKVNKDNEKVDNEDTAQNTQTNYLDAQKRQANNLDAAKRQTDNLNAEKTQESLAADRNGESKNNVNVASSNSADVENREGRQRVQQSQKRGENNKGVKAKTTTKKAVEKNATKKNSKKPATKPAPKETKKAMPKRGAKSVPEETPASTRLLRNTREPPPPPKPDVYEFDAELEASRPPSSLRRRGQPADATLSTPEPQPLAQPAPKPPSPENVEYLDILPSSSRCLKITPQKQPETGAEFPSLRLVPKEEISTNQKKNLIENLSNSPALLNKFFNCLTAEMQTELGNLIAAEGLNEASTSKEETYLVQKAGSVFEAPTFYPTAEEFMDPIIFYDKIAPEASKYGLCKIIPPDGFKPPCNMSDTIRFAVIYQYISKMYSRWGPVSRELAAIKAHLRTQSVVFARSPLLDGSEVNLPKLYHAVERNGGLSKVIQRKRWGRVADEMKLTKLQHPERKLDPIYMRYLLPYATLSDQERQNIMAEVEKCWTTKYQKMLERARNPFQRQNRMLGTECESESDDESEDGNTCGALHEAEDCIVQGRPMNLATFKKIATSLMDAHFEPGKQPPTALDVEKAYWRAVLLGTEHIVANTASIDTGEEGYGFPKDPEVEYGTHPWNLKMLARNPNNVLRYLGSVLGVTVPTLHLSMVFSTSCWHRDPHGLPWTEFLHSGADKIWYGIPRDESANFRRAVETLCPAYCQNKSIWLASEITMVPPNILSEHGVKLSTLIQKPGEYVLVFPEAHSCSITTGFGISESVYFASNAWLTNVYKLFQELRNSCEPTMFSLEQLLLNGSADTSAPQQVCSVLCTLLSAELEHRSALECKGLKVQERPAWSAPLNTSYFRAWNTRDDDECEYCRSTLFLSKVTGLTGRKSAVCPEHALRLLETKKYKNIELSSLEFVSSYSTSALEEMLDRLESRTAEESRAPSVIDLTGPERELGNNTPCSLGGGAEKH